MRTFRYEYCSKCETRRVVSRYSCALCGAPIRVNPVQGLRRLTGASLRQGEPINRRPKVVGWQELAGERESRAA